MKVGAVYPQIELGGAPEGLDSIGRGVEALGLDHLLMYDHVVGAVHEGRIPPLTGPYTQNDPFHDPFVAFSYLAGITKTIDLVTGILILPQRQTVLVAKQAADVDLLSGERLRLGVGVGWNPVEYAALGQAFNTRGARLDEQIPFLRRLWTEAAIEWTGRFDRIDRANIVPRPKRVIPIYCGGNSEAAYKRAARMGDGFVFAGSQQDSILPAWARIHELLKEAGRPVADFAGYRLIFDETRSGMAPQAAADAVRSWEDVGGTAASIVTMGRGFTTAQQHLDYLGEVRSRIG